MELDAEELFHLALVACNKGDHEKAILHLKRAVELDPKPNMYFMLGAEYAEIGMHARAFDYMQQAVLEDPSLWMAHFQSGLLKLILGDIQAATEAWLPLDDLGESDALVLFKNGLLQIERGEVEPGVVSVRRGLEANLENPALNLDMERVLDRVATQTGSVGVPVSDRVVVRDQAVQKEKSSEDESSEDLNHLFLSAYRVKTKQ